MNVSMFWDVILGWVIGAWRFDGMCYLNSQV